MDAKKLGSFIATQRKELGLTQADLAEKLHVTDKAISRWERGLGLPDINTIEPLSVALNVSVVEVMKSELLTEAITEQDTSNVIKDVIDLLEKKRVERRKICIFFLIASCKKATIFGRLILRLLTGSELLNKQVCIKLSLITL